MYNNKNVKIMKKNLFLAALAFVAVASCTSDEFVGENTSPTNGNTAGAISFGSNAGKITRATSNTGTVAEMLDGQFKVYGTKNVKANNADAYSTVFPSYVAWSSTTVTTSNPDGTSGDDTKGWEYVGASGKTYGSSPTNGTLSSEQTIKYWDYSADNYHFVAGSPVANFTYTITNTNNDIVSATVSGFAGHINPNTGEAISTNPVYIAKPVNVTSTYYNTPVTFEFVRQQSRVRVGVFETIPGYKITNIKFYPYETNAWATTPSENIVLASTTDNYFVGASSASATVTYNWTGSTEGVTYPNYTFAYNTTGLTQAKNWYAGKLNADGWVMATTSTEGTIATFYGSDSDMESTTGYFTVIPTPSGTIASPILIKCDYTLAPVNDNEGSTETINVKGATAAIPAAFSKWAPNTSYTYLFKISDNTNGYTGSTSQPEGLFPITFDAVAVAEATGTEQGYITTVSTPSITTYQEGSVTTTGIQYKTGTAINFTVQNDETGVLYTLNTTNESVGCVKVFSLGSTAKTEADLQLIPPTTELATGNPTGSTGLSLPTSAWDNNGQSIAANNYGTFTPGAVGYYAIQYLVKAAEGTTPAVYAYKVVYVVASGS